MQLFLSIREIDYNKTILYWDTEADLREDMHKFVFMVQISESRLGPWDNLFKDPIYGFGFVDTMTQRGMADQRLYYRVLAIYVDGTEYVSNLVCLSEENNNYLSNFIAKQEQLVLRRLNGRECLLYPRRKFGNRCKHCYSVADAKCIKAKCKFCFGTTYEGGYFAPIKIYVNFDMNNKAADKNEYGVSENLITGGWTSTESIIESLDILVELKNPDSRFIIGGLSTTSVKDAVVKQILQLTQVMADRVEQLLPFVGDAFTMDEFNVFRREWNH